VTRVLLAALVAGAVVLVSTPVAMAVATRLGVVDRPGALKRQSTPVPYLGGAAVYVAVVTAVVLGRPVVLVPLALALVLGVADDTVGTSPWVRLAGQGVVGGIVAAVIPTRLPGPAGPILVVGVAVLVMNGANLLDGLDTLAAGVVAVAAGTFAFLLHGGGRYLGAGLACALAGFLVYNRPPARVYLGDGGSYLLGAALTVLLAWAWAPGVRGPVGVASLIVVALPAAEVVFTVVRRLRGRRTMVSGDRGHSYDRMVARGLPAGAAGVVFGAAQVVLGALALGVSAPKSIVPAVVAVVAVAVLLVGTAAASGMVTPEPEPRT
jgi:UDP-GlcNAc:undecaprenyl-phosphate GlcNAc-1-phosphate transferase